MKGKRKEGKKGEEREKKEKKPNQYPTLGGKYHFGRGGGEEYDFLGKYNTPGFR